MVLYPQNNNLPAGIGALGDVFDDGGSQAVTPVKVFIGHNLGNRTFALYVPMHEFYRLSEVANDRGEDGSKPVAQRKLDEKHAGNLARYILRGLVSATVMRRERNHAAVPPAFRLIEETLGRQPYMSLQPLVANIRTCKPEGSNLPGHRMVHEGETACFKVMLRQDDVLWVVDGQHRRYAMRLVFDFLEELRKSHRYPKKNCLFPGREDTEVSAEELQLWLECFEVARTHCTVMVEVHLGLGLDEERQLFHDLNNLGKKIEKGLALRFDGSNAINAFIKSELIDGGLVPVSERDKVDWDDDAIPYKDLAGVNAHLFLNKTNINSAKPAEVESKLEIAKRFWLAVAMIPGFGDPGAKRKTVAAQPVVLKALAKLTYDYAFGRGRDEELLDRVLDGITDLDFSHDNPMWRFYELRADERAALGLDGLAAYLPPVEPGKNRDIGSYQGGFMRFGVRHNDIFPILADMIRWHLRLPNRHEQAVASAA